MRWTRRERYSAGALFLVAVGVRALYLWESAASPTFYEPILDARTHHNLAAEWVQAGTYNEVFLWQAIFYPLFLSGL